MSSNPLDRSGGFVVTVQRDGKPVPVRAGGAPVPRHQALRDLTDAQRSGGVLPRIWSAERFAELNRPSCSICRHGGAPRREDGTLICAISLATYCDCGGPFPPVS